MDRREFLRAGLSSAAAAAAAGTLSPHVALAKRPVPEPAPVESDARVDAKYVSITRQLITYMAQDPAMIPGILDVLWAARALERIGDRCENIAEYIFYLVKGRDLRNLSKEDELAEMRRKDKG